MVVTIIIKNMDNYRKNLEMFRDLKLMKEELFITVPKQPKPKYEPIIVSNYHLINLLSKYKESALDEHVILDWVNTIWFTDWFTYEDTNCECIASIMSELEEIDEEGKELTTEKVDKYIYALERNIEI
jgi:hypothetical protein